MPITFKTKAIYNATATTPVEEPKPQQEPMVITDFAQNYVMYHAHKNTAKKTPPRHHNRIHISDLDPSRQWCPREPALLTLHDEKRPPVFITTAQRTTFSMGYKGSDAFMEMLPPEMVWGNWRCRNCTHVHLHTYTPKRCVHCNAPRKCLDYKEVLFRDPDTNLTGSVDLIVDLLGNGTLTIVETKTEGGETFKARNKAEFDHEWRTKGYMWLASISKATKHLTFSNTARIVYINKTGHADAPQIKEWKVKDAARSSFKEYFVNRDDSFLDNQLAKARSYRKWRDVWDNSEGASIAPLPDRVCTSPNDTRAQNCHVCKKCWKGST